MNNTLRIFTINNPKEEKVLRTVSRQVKHDEISNPEFQKFLDQLLQTALTSEKQVGVQSAGISAPQVGKNLRVFYILRKDTENFELFINPEVTIASMKQDIDWEGCLSVPGVEDAVSRYKKVKVVYLDREGKKHKATFKGIEAREIQHELDHLDGILFIDRIEE
jgi:peptide deformylase